MLTEKFTLPIGVDHAGKVHKEGVLRPRIVKDMIAATGSELFLKDKNNYEISCLANQIIALGDIPREEITGELIADMYEDDFDALSEAANVARKRVASFRDQKSDGQEGSSGTAQDGV